MPGPLDGIRVLDFSHALAGPYCTMLMAAYGAEVYKVEGIDIADIGRTWGPPFQGNEASFFLGLNSGKHGLSIDLKQPRGIELCLKLAGRCDVLIENYRPGTLARLGLGYPQVRARNKKLVYCSISGYGQNGPSRDEPAMDLILQAASGLISVTGTDENHLARCGHSVADITAGMFALAGILMALRSRDLSGQGQLVDVSMLDSMISAMASNYALLFGSGTIPKPLGTAFATIVPYRTLKTKDREITIAVASEKLWQMFCAAIGRADLANHPDYRANSLRVRNRAVLEPMLDEIFAGRTAGEWLDILKSAGIPCTLVRNLAEVAADAQAAAREMFPEVEHPAAGSVRVTGPPLKLGAAEGRIRFAAPRLGEHTRQVLESVLGMSPPEIEALAEEGIIPARVQPRAV